MNFPAKAFFHMQSLTPWRKRGTIAIGMCMGTKQMKFLFRELWGNQEIESMDSALKQTPLIDGNLALSACRSIENLQPLCKAKGELQMYGALLGTARALITSSRDGQFWVDRT